MSLPVKNSACAHTMEVEPDEKTAVRGYFDGCFDLMHAGHFNALRQAKKLCDVLVVGVHTDKVIAACKAPPVIRQDERYAILRHLKWIDEILYGVPYSPSLETLKLAKADFCVHGDDMPNDENGECAYDIMKNAGKLRIIKRTEGVSTTDIVGRILTAIELRADPNARKSAEIDSLKDSGIHTLCTVSRLAEFSAPYREPTEDDVVVYMDGDFDMFNISHASVMEKAKALGTYLIVGVYDDSICKNLEGEKNVFESLCERALAVCACKHVDNVIIASPYIVTPDLLTTMKVSYVAQGTQLVRSNQSGIDPYAIPKELGIYRQIEADFSYLTKDIIISRVEEKRDAYASRNSPRHKKEAAYYEEKNIRLAQKLGTREKEPRDSGVVVNS